MVKSKSAKRFEILAHVVMIFVTICIVLPFILLFMSSITSETGLVRDGYSFFPKEFSLHAYKFIWDNASNVFRAYGITIFVTVVGTAINLAMSALLAYPLSLKDLPGKRIISFYIFFTMLFNGGLVPTYINYTTVFHVKDTFFGLLVPSLMMSAFNVLLMKSYFVTGVPDEILEAAYIDGANEFQTMWKIAIPLSKPIITTVAMFSGIAYWNDWNNGYIYLTKRTDLYSIQNLLNRLMQNIQALTQNANNMAQAGEGLSQIPSGTVRMAMAALGILPIMIIYPFIQKNFVKGITLGGVKG